MTSLYKIKKGNHKHSNWFSRLFFLNLKKDKTVSDCLEGTCWYDESLQTYTGWNKLGGVSGLFHHKNSARLVWRPDKKEGVFKLAAYVYVDGECIIKELRSVSANIWFDRRIKADKGEWYITINNIGVIIKSKKTPCWRILDFYFGGKETAPHAMRLKEKCK